MCKNYLSNECNDINTSESNISSECNDVKVAVLIYLMTMEEPTGTPPAASSAVGILMPTH